MSNTIGIQSIVEIDENERYWMGHGFGKRGLLPTDRGAFSTTDGSLSWNSLEEAREDLVLLGRGWSFAEDEYFAANRKEDDGWMYASDFRSNHIADAKPDRGKLHWVRFRRLIGTKVFQPAEFVSPDIYNKCDHCDSVEVDSLSNLLIDVTSYISLLQSTSEVTDYTLYPLKNSIINIAISHERPEAGKVDALKELNELLKKFMFHVEKERSKHAMSRLLSKRLFLFAERHDQPDFHQRCCVIAGRCFPKTERDAIAGLIVRKLDPDHQFHCEKVDCGPTCVFRRVPCPNKGCSKSMSRVHLQAHDAVCEHKVTTCDCGVELKYREMPAHLRVDCQLRRVDCPFKSLGCTKYVHARDLREHLAEDTTSHLLLVMGKFERQTKEIVDLRETVEVLQAENSALLHSIERQKESVAIEIQQVNKTVSKVEKDLRDFEKLCRKDIKTLKEAKQTLT